MHEFVSIVVRATVIFYQLDVKSGETTEVLLHNLLTSLTLKNPVYSRIFELFRSSCRLPMKQIEAQLEAVRERRDQLMAVFGVNDVDIGSQLLEAEGADNNLSKVEEE